MFTSCWTLGNWDFGIHRGMGPGTTYSLSNWTKKFQNWLGSLANSLRRTKPPISKRPAFISINYSSVPADCSQRSSNSWISAPRAKSGWSFIPLWILWMKRWYIFGTLPHSSTSHLALSIFGPIHHSSVVIDLSRSIRREPSLPKTRSATVLSWPVAQREEWTVPRAPLV